MRILFLTHRLPYAPNRGDRTRAYYIIRALAARGELHVGALVHDAHEAAQVERVRSLGAASVMTFHVPKMFNYLKGAIQLPGAQPLTHALLDSPEALPKIRQLVAERRPDVVLAFCSSMAKFALLPPLDTTPLVIDMVDVDSVKWDTLSRTARWPMNWVYRRETRLLGGFEAYAARRAFDTLVVNEREAAALLSHAPDASVHVMKIGADLASLRPQHPPVEEPRLVFCGVMNYGPNAEGVSWFAREVFPLIRARRPDARFTIVGSEPTEAVRRLGGRGSGITVTGTVPDVRSYLWKSAVSIAPLLVARGVQNKVLEAIAAGLPSVVTSQVLEGLPREICVACRVADDAAEFAAATLTLLDLTGNERRQLAARADLDALTWDNQLAPLYGLLERAAASRRS